MDQKDVISTFGTYILSMPKCDITIILKDLNN